MPLNFSNNMKIIYTLLIHLLFSINLIAQVTYTGPIRFKGEINDGNFYGSTFEIEAKAEGFVVNSLLSKENVFFLKSDAQILKDAVISMNNTAVALALKVSGESGDSNAVLASICKSGEIRVYRYREQKMTDQVGWIIELGAVSDDAKMVLAKCAQYRPEKNGIQAVNHNWTILAINQNSIEVVKIFPDSESAFVEWFNLLHVPAKIE